MNFITYAIVYFELVFHFLKCYSVEFVKNECQHYLVLDFGRKCITGFVMLFV